MSLDTYLFEKACYIPEALARLAEAQRLILAGSLGAREVSANLGVAMRYGLLTCCAVSGATLEGDWVVRLSREGWLIR